MLLNVANNVLHNCLCFAITGTAQFDSSFTPCAWQLPVPSCNNFPSLEMYGHMHCTNTAGIFLSGVGQYPYLFLSYRWTCIGLRQIVGQCGQT
jgi:hypothetical protein